MVIVDYLVTGNLQVLIKVTKQLTLKERDYENVPNLITWTLFKKKTFFQLVEEEIKEI